MSFPAPKPGYEAFDAFSMLLYYPDPPETAPVLDEAERKALHAEHVAWVKGLRDAGVAILNGLFDPGGGIIVLTVGPDEARELVAGDPFVIRGWLKVDVLTWRTPPGSMTPLVERAART